jgi:hypothetical protein
MTIEECLKLAQFRINEMPSGQVLIGDIYGEYWDSVPNHTKLGIKFKDAVLSGRLRGIKWIERRTDNNQLCEIAGRSD